MKIIYRRGDLFGGPETFIAHGVNARGVARSGVAGLVRAKYPKAIEDYETTFKTKGLKLGDLIWSDCGDRIILHCVSQQDYGREPNRVYVSYDAIAIAMSRIDELCFGQSVAMPLIGAGLAHGHWPTIAAVIQRFTVNVQPIVYVMPADEATEGVVF
jgi:O-acetyl-ADP-ribose deacetylase (regulator of RNase III)